MAIGFSSSVQAWVPYLAPLDDGAHGGLGFLQAWLQRESDGNPCSYSPSAEAGIWQLMPGDNMTVARTTLALQHPVPPCVAGRQTDGKTVNDLTQDQIDEQIRAGTEYLDYCIKTARTALKDSPIDDTQADFWRFVKLVHGAPAWVSHGVGMVSQELGSPVSSWDDFESVAKNHGCWGSNHCTSTLANARAVGAYGGNDPQPGFTDQIIVLSGAIQPTNWWMIGLAALGGLAIGVGLYQRRAHRRVGRAV